MLTESFATDPSLTLTHTHRVPPTCLHILGVEVHAVGDLGDVGRLVVGHALLLLLHLDHLLHGLLLVVGPDLTGVHREQEMSAKCTGPPWGNNNKTFDFLVPFMSSKVTLDRVKSIK